MTMRAVIPPRVAGVWLLLVAATLTSWWLGAEHALSSVQAASIVVLAFAFVKVRFVGMYFMDLRLAPTALRAAFEGWCLTVAALMIALYLYA